MKKNLLLAQSGGPTAAINATVAGAFTAGHHSDSVERVYGAVNGIKGVTLGHIIDITDTLSDEENLRLLMTTPAAALGSCRMKLKSPDEDPDSYKKIVDEFRSYNIGYFVYTGGNDSMDTVLKLSEYFDKNGISDIKVMGAPKTIDNDLTETDHCPGFGSAAKYIAVTFSELRRDCEVYDIPAVTVVEVMGRNAGWLTAASALADVNDMGPDLIYLPEVAFSEEQFVRDVRCKLKKHNAVIVAVSEGIKTADGKYAAECCMSGDTDVFGHKYLAGTARYLESIVRREIDCKVRSIELNLMQRCSAHIASQTDIDESFLLGSSAAIAAINGEKGKMTALRRVSQNPYKTEIYTADIKKIANAEKCVPREFINSDGNYVTRECTDYILPLIYGESYPIYKNGLPVHIKLY